MASEFQFKNRKGLTVLNSLIQMITKYLCSPLDLAPGNDQIYEETQEKFLTAGNPQDGQVVLYRVRREFQFYFLDTLSNTDILLFK